MNNYKIIACDLDGTFLKDDMSTSEENWAAVEQLKELGVHFVPTTGRAYGEIPKEIRGNGNIRFIIHSGGAVVYDKLTDTEISAQIPKELSHLILDTIGKFDTSIMFHYNRDSYVDADCTKETYLRTRLTPNFITCIKQSNVHIHNFKEFTYSAQNVDSMCIFFASDSEMAYCTEVLSENPNLLVTKSNPNNIEVYSSKAGKGNALKRLAKKLCVDIKDTIAVGDSPNDIAMLSDAGLSLAVSNSDVELKKIADDIICSNEEHCVNYILEKYIK